MTDVGLLSFWPAPEDRCPRQLNQYFVTGTVVLKGLTRLFSADVIYMLYAPLIKATANLIFIFIHHTTGRRIEEKEEKVTAVRYINIISKFQRSILVTPLSHFNCLRE